MGRKDFDSLLEAVEDSMVRVLNKETNGLPEQIETTVVLAGETRKLVILVLEVEAE